MMCTIPDIRTLRISVNSGDGFHSCDIICALAKLPADSAN